MDKWQEGIDYFIGEDGAEGLEKAREILESADKALETAEDVVRSLRDNVTRSIAFIKAAEDTRNKMADGYEKGMELLKRFGLAK